MRDKIFGVVMASLVCAWGLSFVALLGIGLLAIVGVFNWTAFLVAYGVFLGVPVLMSPIALANLPPLIVWRRRDTTY